MTNYGFEIHINDKYLCRAGFENAYHVLSLILTSAKRTNNTEDLAMNIAGVNSETENYCDWVNTPLKLGDRISIQIVTENFDKPLRVREKESSQFVLERKLEYYHKLKEELKEHLDGG